VAKVYDIIITRQRAGRPLEPVCFTADLNSAERRLLRIPRKEWGGVQVWTLGAPHECLFEIDFYSESLKAKPVDK